MAETSYAETGRAGSLITTALVAGRAGRSVKTIEAWVRDDVLPPSDFVNDAYAVFYKEYIDAVAPAMALGKAAVVERVAQLRADGCQYWNATATIATTHTNGTA